MNKKKNYDFTSLVIIFALILIIISLVLIIYKDQIFTLPPWFGQTLMAGLFTLAGAGAGAFFAGKYTLKSVEKQIEHTKRENQRIEITTNNNALKIIEFALEEFFAVFSYATIPFDQGKVNNSVLQLAINEFKKPLNKIELILQDTALLSRISDEFVIEVPSKIRMHTSHLKNIIESVNEHDLPFNETYSKNVSKNLNMIYKGLNEVKNRIEEIIDEKRDT